LNFEEEDDDELSVQAALATASGAPAVNPRVVVQVISPWRSGSMPKA
jgi:hypothetical protein